MQNMRHKKLAAMLLTLVMALSLLSMTAFAEEKTVTDATSLKDAIADGNTIILGASIDNVNIEIPQGVTVTLNLNGYTLTGAAGTQDVISNKGTLTLEGSGKVIAPKGGAVVNYPGATAIIKGGEYNAETWYTIKNLGEMEIYDGVTIAAETGGSSLIANGWFGNGTGNDRNEPYPSDGSSANLTIYGGSFSGGMNTVKNDDYGVVTIHDGTFKNSNGPTILNWNEATLNGGDFSVPSGFVLAYGYANDTADKGQFTINGGTFTSGNGGEDHLFGVGDTTTPGGFINVQGGEFFGKLYPQSAYSATVTISEGSFSSEVDPSLIDTSKTAASLTSGGNTTYYIGDADSISQALASAAKVGDVITVQQGNADFTDVAAGVQVANDGNGTVSANGVPVEQGSSTTTTEPEPEPEDPVSEPSYDKNEGKEFAKVEVGETDSSSHADDENKDNPSTGDSSNLAIAVAAMLISAGGAAAAFLSKQKKA